MPSKSNIIKAIFIGLFQIILLTLVFLYCDDHIKQTLADNDKRNESNLNPNVNDVGLTKIDWNQVIKAKPEPITAGIFLDRIQDFDIVKSKWSCEFSAWFKWNPKKINFIDLRDSVKGAINVYNMPIKVVNGTIEHIETHSFYLNVKRDSAYILFHVVATTTKFFDVSQYPLDNYLLMIQLENVNYDIHKAVFIPDSASSNLSSRVSVNGFEKDEHCILSKPHTILSTLGDPRKVAREGNTYSQLRFGLYIKRGGLGIYLKIFVTLYIAVFLGFLSFFAADSDKIRVIVGSLFFAAATLNIIITRIPATNGISIAEIVNDISLLTILWIAIREIIIKYIFKSNKELETLNKWITFFITLVFYVSINILIPVSCLKSLK